ncbi:DUF4389 domain-containing protein [Marinimicrobium alkaliphilum]|uniref:DUF4389 domain-containing protein n=1 Tax=Marinimicrobium alkaliphilum TaxID=2202654 RepID=UPI000DB94760|nr:DUF4389 domain-containing protein [Marinimicrobium alkaliphilum]
MKTEQLKIHLLSVSTWLRLPFMLLFWGILQLLKLALFVVVVLQFVFLLFTGDDNENLRRAGASLSSYVYQILRFLSFNTEQKPFPFADWPAGEPVDLDAQPSEDPQDRS